MSEPGRRRGSCGRETRDRGAWFPLGTPPGLQAPPLPKMYPPPQPSCPKERRGRRPRPPAPGSTSRPAPRPDRPRLPPHPGAGNAAAGARGPVQAAPLVAASLPHPNRPRPSPQGPARDRAAATGLHNPAGDGGRGGHGRGRRRPRSAGGKTAAGGDPEPPSSAAPSPLDTLPPPLLSGPESVTGIGFQHGGQEAAPRGGENIPAAPALGGAGPGRRPREEPRGLTAGSGARKGRLEVEMTRETRGPGRPPKTGSPKATGGLGVAGEGGHFLNSAHLPSPRRLQKGLATPPKSGFARPS